MEEIEKWLDQQLTSPLSQLVLVVLVALARLLIRSYSRSRPRKPKRHRKSPGTA